MPDQLLGVLPVAFPCRPQQAQQLQLPGGLAEAHSGLLDVAASPLPTLDCCTSNTKRISRVIILGLILQEKTNPQPPGNGLNGKRTNALP